jgi:hypothetical protein
MKITSYQPKTDLKHLSIYWKSALIHKNVHSFCAVFNHFGYKLNHLERPSFNQPHLVNAIFKYLYPYNKVTLNKPIPSDVANKLLPKLKELHGYFKEHTFVTEDGQLKPVILSEATTEPDYDEEVYICPHCNYTHTSDCCVSHARLHCDNCNKVSRANPTPLIELEETPDIFYDIAVENIHYLIEEFLRINQDFQALYIEGRNLNWRGSSGYATSTLDISLCSLR